MRRSQINTYHPQQQAQNGVQQQKYQAPVNNHYRNLYYGNSRSQQTGASQYYNTDRPSQPNQTAVRDTNAEKLQAAREAREELDLYKSFEVDEDKEFYPHQNEIFQSSEHGTSALSSHFYGSKAQQQLDQTFRSPLNTPDRFTFQANLHTNNGKLYSTNGKDAAGSFHSPKSQKFGVYQHNNSTAYSAPSYANRSSNSRPYSGQSFYSQYGGNRSQI